MLEKTMIKVAHPSVGEEEVEAVRKVILSGNYVSGKIVREFEDRFAEYIGTNHAVAVSSGTAALIISLQALGIKKGDEVIVPPLTFFSTVTSVIAVGATPVFADIDSDDMCLSPKDFERRITAKTRAVIPVHLFGNAAKMDELMMIAEARDIAVVEDCAQAHGTEYKGRRVGGFGKTGCFSFFATKHMTTGEGGMITTDDPGIADKARMIRSHGMTGRDEHVVFGLNSRMTEIEAAMGLVQLGRLDGLNDKRIANSEYLIKELHSLEWAIVSEIDPQIKHTYFWTPLMVDEEGTGKSFEELKTHLSENGIGFRQRYQEPLYRQKVLGELGLDYSAISLPNVENIAGKVLGLPNHPGLSKSDLNRVVEVLKSF